jgi:NADPH-dependent curcumin reductase CurA
VSTTNHQWLLTARPKGLVTESNFEWREEPVGELADGEILIRNIYLSLDPTNRGWMAFDTYLPAVPLGTVMRGITIGVVESSRNPRFQPGDVVQGMGGWQEYCMTDGSGFMKLPRIPGQPLSLYFGAMGHIGFTAYFGILDIGQPKAGETLVVSAAAGAVGSIAGQIGKIQGCRVVGIAGSDDKCHWITSKLGFDAAINYKKEDVRKALGQHCPSGVDIDFENVGGDIMEAVFDHLNNFARVALCGLISQYNAATPSPGPRNFSNLLIRRVNLRGFIVLDYVARYQEAAQQILAWITEGRIQYRLDVVAGLQQAPAALIRLFEGGNTGKLLVKLAEEPA